MTGKHRQKPTTQTGKDMSVKELKKKLQDVQDKADDEDFPPQRGKLPLSDKNN